MSGLFPDAVDLIRVTVEDMLKEIDRELAMRRWVYPQWVEAGKVDGTEAKLRLARLQAARNVIHNLVIGPGVDEQTIEPEGMSDA